MSNVVDKIIEKCRNAILGGIPILYIKTDSDVLINKIIEDENRPLVQLLCGSSSGGSRYSERPLSERKADGLKCRLNDAENYSNSLPNSFETISYPHIWAYKMPGMEDASSYNSALRQLEKYVLAHEDKNHSRYNILQYSVVLLFSSNVNISQSLLPYTEFVDVEYPDEDEIRNIILNESLNDPHLACNDAYLSALCTSFSGFSNEDIVLTMQKIRATSSFEDSESVEQIIYDRKKQKMEGGILEYYKLDESDISIGGMADYKSWLEKQIEPLKNSNIYSRTVGTTPPKGVLLCGIPGCGKSEAAKFTAHELGLPLLKMDVGNLMDKYQGVSEQRMREALKLAEAMSPCVLWIDELEKGFSGAGANKDSSSFQRMFGYMLGWMQDNKKPCFIFATANNIGDLPKEFFRSGRFDALYAVYLPTIDECVKIIQTCMNKTERRVAKLKRIKKSDVVLFDKDCYSASLLREFIISELVHNNIPRIVIGSDLKKITDTALRSLIEEEKITQSKWSDALKAAARESIVYGDGQENIDSIAVSYCRMLRKGFIPTGDRVLFDTKDYHVENIEQLKKLKSKRDFDMSDDEKQKHLEEIDAAQILQRSNKVFDNKYDEAVYDLLYSRINDFALHIEQVEREKMIGR